MGRAGDPLGTSPSTPAGTTPPAPEAAPPPDVTSAIPAETTSTTLAPDPRLGSGEAVTFAFGGDVHFEGVIRSALDRDPASVLAGYAPVLAGADVAVVNLETAITTRGTPAPKKFTFRAPDTAFVALRAAGVDVVSMANNHGLDFGPVGLEDSLLAAEAAAFPVVGIGRDEVQAFAPWITEVRGQRIAVIGATQVLDSNLLTAWTATADQAGLASAKREDRLVQAVRDAREVADTVVVMLHWGTEKMNCPNDPQQALAPVLVEAGADIVVGGHAHRVLGGGRLGDAVVHYGLGNFVFSTSGGPGADTGVFTVTATGRRIDAYDWVPGRIAGGLPTPLAGTEHDRARGAWEALRDCTGLAP